MTRSRSWQHGVLLLGLLAVPLSAQSIRGRVVLPDSITPVSGATIVLRDAVGTVVGRVQSGADGRYVVRVPGAGSYGLQAIRIGFGPVQLSVDGLARGEERSLTLIMIERPLELAAVEVQGDDRCRMSRGDREKFVQIWPRVRAALGPHISVDAPGLAVRVLEVEGTEDGPTRSFTNVRIPPPSNRHHEVDSTLARDHYPTKLLATTPVESLLRDGFVSGDLREGRILDVPNPEAILSDGFLATYCFSVDGGPRGHGDWIGLRFRPLDNDTSRAQVTGTLWVDPESALPRRLEYEYRNLPPIPYESCVSRNHPLRLIPRQTWAGPNCRMGDASGRRWITPREGLGGTVEFATFGQGRWFVTTWRIRGPGREFVHRDLGYSTRTEAGQPVRCSDRGARCTRLFWAMPQLIVAEGAVASIVENGVALFRDVKTLEAIQRVAAMQAGQAVAHLAGIVTDASGQPIVGAVVSTVAPVRSAITDHVGRFEIPTLPAGEVVFRVRGSGYAMQETRFVLEAGTTREVSVALARPN